MQERYELVVDVLTQVQERHIGILTFQFLEVKLQLVIQVLQVMVGHVLLGRPEPTMMLMLFVVLMQVMVSRRFEK